MGTAGFYVVYVIGEMGCKAHFSHRKSHTLIDDNPRDVARAILIEYTKILNQLLQTFLKGFVRFKPKITTLEECGVGGVAKHKAIGSLQHIKIGGHKHLQPQGLQWCRCGPHQLDLEIARFQGTSG